MKTPIITTLCFLMVCLSYGQKFNRSHQLSVGAGHETNAFLRPNSLLEDDELLERPDLWDNGTYQSVALSNGLKWQKGPHKFKLKLNGTLGIYQTEENSNRYSITAGFAYRVKYGSKKYFEFAPEYYLKKRRGINGDQAVLATPFSFQQVRVPVSFDFYLGDMAWLKSEAGYFFKGYDQPNAQVLQYRAPFLQVSFSKKWTLGENITRLTVESRTQWRKYKELDRIVTEILFEDDFEEEEEEFFEEEGLEDSVYFRAGERDWTYYFNDASYAFWTANKSFRAELGLFSMIRSDARAVSSYTEVGPGVSTEVKLEKLSLSTSLRYSIRRYSRLAPGADNNLLLQYRYLRGKFGITYQLGRRTSFYGKYTLINRTSNNPNVDRTSFREYFYASGELGIRWKW